MSVFERVQGLPREATSGYTLVAKWGFSLVESLVIISIISILTSISLVALPAARAHQQLVSDTELIRSLLLDSKQRALNQVRPEECVKFVAEVVRPQCSDVGIDLSVPGKVTHFADTVTTGKYNAGDYQIATHNISTAVTPNGFTTLVFHSAPPTVQLYKDTTVMEPSHTATITLTASNGATRTLTVRQFGTIDVE